MDAHAWTGEDDRDEGCSDDPTTCLCPACEQWRAIRRDEEGVRFDEALGFGCGQREAMAQAQRLKR